MSEKAWASVAYIEDTWFSLDARTRKVFKSTDGLTWQNITPTWAVYDSWVDEEGDNQYEK